MNANEAMLPCSILGMDKDVAGNAMRSHANSSCVELGQDERAASPSNNC